MFILFIILLSGFILYALLKPPSHIQEEQPAPEPEAYTEVHHTGLPEH